VLLCDLIILIISQTPLLSLSFVETPPYLIYEIENVGVCLCVCMFTYRSGRDKPNCPKFGMIMPLNQEEILEGSKLQKSVLRLSPGEGGFCSSETKYDRRRPEARVISTRKLQEQRPLPRKICPGFESQ
jgi:hypothetical protein